MHDAKIKRIFGIFFYRLVVKKYSNKINIIQVHTPMMWICDLPLDILERILAAAPLLETLVTCRQFHHVLSDMNMRITVPSTAQIVSNMATFHWACSFTTSPVWISANDSTTVMTVCRYSEDVHLLDYIIQACLGEWGGNVLKDCRLQNTIMAAAAQNIYGFKILRWLWYRGCEGDARVCANLAQVGRLDAIKWCHFNEIPWDAQTSWRAAANGHLSLLRWVNSHGCPWDYQTPIAASRSGHLDILKWAIREGCPCNPTSCLRAATCPRVVNFIEKFFGVN